MWQSDETPLHKACAKAHTRAAAIVIDEGSNVDIPSQVRRVGGCVDAWGVDVAHAPTQLPGHRKGNTPSTLPPSVVMHEPLSTCAVHTPRSMCLTM